MSVDTPGDVWKLAQCVCTEKQLAALRHLNAGFSSRRAAAALGITREAYRDRLDGAFLKIRRATTPKEG